MELKVVQQSKNKLIFSLKGEDHTFCNPLIKCLQKVSGVKAAAYTIEHPLERIPKVLVETTGSVSPADALAEAVKELKNLNKEFVKKFQAAIK